MAGPDVPELQEPATLYEGVQSIFTRSCAFSGCHAGATPQEGMDLSASSFHVNTVGVASHQVPGLYRVHPGQPDSSYVIYKLEGRAGSVGGIGTQMPLGGSLTSAQVDSVRAWIQAGAPNR